MFHHNTPHFPSVMNRNINIQNSTFNILHNRKSNEEFLNRFISEKNEQRDVHLNGYKICEIKCALKSVRLLNRELIRLTEELKREDLSNHEWMEKRNSAEKVKEEVQLILGNLKREEVLTSVKKYLERRKSKRRRERRVKEQWKAKKEKLKERRVRLHNEADSWIKKGQNIAEKEKQEENLRRDADLVLFDVRGKSNDAKRYLSLLKEMENLRRVKVAIVKARGEYVSSVADETFKNIIDKLTQQWLSLDREYTIEEKGLKLMVQTDNNSKLKKQKIDIYECWEKLLFGKKLAPNCFLQGNMNTFIAMRFMWDRFLNANEGTPIPIGWIVPNKPSSGAWQHYVKK